MTTLTPDVFSFVVEYSKEIIRRKELLNEFDEDDEGLVMFCQEFFNQFFADEFGVQLASWSSREAAEVWVAVKDMLEHDDLREEIVAAYREFSQDYDVIIGEHYDKGGTLSEFQITFCPDLLRAIDAWAETKTDTDLGEAASMALDELEHALEKIG